MQKHILKRIKKKKELATFWEAPNPIRSPYKSVPLLFKKAACISKDFQTEGTF